MNTYRDIDAAYRQLRRRPPRWVDALIVSAATTDPAARLDQVVTDIRNDNPPEHSDRLIRALASISRKGDSAASIVLLHALAPALRNRIRRGATSEYHQDAITTLAMVCLDSDLVSPRLARRLVNRAHNRAWRDSRRSRHHGTTNPVTTDPCDPTTMATVTATNPDPADIAANRADLSAFATAARSAVANGDLPAKTWAIYRDHRVARAVTGVEGLSGSQRVELHRAGNRVAALIDQRLRILVPR